MEHDGQQIYPASITGKGSRFAPGGSVLDHTFGNSDPYTLGVEEEYMLLDADTFDLFDHVFVEQGAGFVQRLLGFRIDDVLASHAAENTSARTLCGHEGGADQAQAQSNKPAN